MTPRQAYAALIRHSQQTALLGSCAELLGWDEETYMPPAGVEHRGRQMALLAGLHHERLTDPSVGDWLAQVEGSSLVKQSDSDEAVNARLWRRAYDRACRLPRSLVEELAQTASIAQQQWVVARRQNDFARLLPWLEKIVTLKRSEAGAYGWTGEAYDALLQDYEPGACAAQLARTLSDLQKQLRPLLDLLGQARRRPDGSILGRRFPLTRQRTFVKKVAGDVGFDFQAGRLDSTTHPFFTTVGPGDCRITTRYALNRFGDAFFAGLHEVGHGLYEQGLPAADFGTPLGECPSVALHESQARLWENTVGRSLGFWRHYFAPAQQAFPAALRDVALEQFHFALHRVEPSLLRIQADEVTYNLHIVVRVELERALINGELAPAELPQAWNAAYERVLGLTPPSDADGCLQDGHWAAGMFGYFPTYALGSIIAAQLFAQAQQDLGNLDEAFARGDFAVLLGWLGKGIYSQGSHRTTAELVQSITGAPPGAGPLVDMLWRTYGELYGVSS
jgi:carboxypeptidase Taq